MYPTYEQIAELLAESTAADEAGDPGVPYLPVLVVNPIIAGQKEPRCVPRNTR